MGKLNISQSFGGGGGPGPKAPPLRLCQGTSYEYFGHCLHIVLALRKYTDTFWVRGILWQEGDVGGFLHGGIFHGGRNFLWKGSWMAGII